ncbi:AMP-binding protein [Marichromatium gracile]|uniref:phenylacetate--CoA ligase family protein n=1 Tax=Marichromatium gracile TaxID=1048 RepID=UPI001F46516E|nr:AMP-binding protein [Marichromatium gracile]MCF1182290.1 AMP-binding protein [Marichromatium gracile]
MFPWIESEHQLGRAREIWHAALAAPFFAAKYAGMPAPMDWMQWRALPVLSRQELYDNAWPRTGTMLTVPPEGMIVTSTGGTSGMARYTVLTHAEWDRFCAEQARALALIGVGAKDRVANLLVAGSLWPSFLGGHEIIKRLGALHLPISANIPVETVLRFCREFQPTVMLSLPTLFVFLADLALRDAIRFPGLRLIAYAGEHMSPAVRAHLQHAFGAEVEIHALAYTSADAGLMGYQCRHCAPNAYHVPSDFQLIEVVDMERGRVAESGEEGELLVTNLARRSQPIVRYRIGDRGCYTGESCACGDRNPVLRLAGRAGDDFKLGGAYVAMAVVERAVETVSGRDGISPNYCLRIADEANRIALELVVEAGDPAAAAPHAETLVGALETAIPELGVARERGYLARLEARFVALGSLERSPVTGKVRHLHDLRVEEPAS